ncbi:MAG: DUF1294 domain-containing protein [Bulleidia sp.]
MLSILLISSLIAFLLCGWDKFCALSRRRRVPEAILFAVSICLGAAGMWAGMVLFHHKTRKAKFRFGIPLLFFIQLFLLWRLTA